MRVGLKSTYKWPYTYGNGNDMAWHRTICLDILQFADEQAIIANEKEDMEHIHCNETNGEV